MKRFVPVLALVLLLAVPGLSHAIVEVGLGINSTSFSEDADSLDSDNGTTLDVVLGTGMARLMLSFVQAEPEGIDYKATMIGPAFVLGAVGFDFRVYGLLADHELSDVNTLSGTGLTLGGGFGFPVFPRASIGADVRISQWDDEGFDIGTGTFSVLFRLDF